MREGCLKACQHLIYLAKLIRKEERKEKRKAFGQKL